MDTIKVTFQKLSNIAQEELIAILDANNQVLGFEQKEDVLLAYFEKQYFNTESIQELLPNYSYTIENIAPQNWNALWESNFAPVIVANFCGVRANFHTPINAVQYEIIITPKMSFGTGHHATTYQVIQAMEHLPIQNATVCDFGTGTGVLAILAEKLGANSVTAIDNDDWSIDNTKENIAVNNCKKITVIKDAVIKEATYQIILANINKNVLLKNMPRLAKSVAKGGYLILSGILTEDKEDIQDSLSKHQFTVQHITERHNWLCITCVK